MGFDFATADAMTGAIFMGAGGSMPFIWTLISIAVCVVACIAGSKHELDAYKKIKK